MVPVNLCQQCLIQITHFPAQPSATDAPRPDPTTLSPTRRTCITALSIMVKILLSDFRSHINHAGNLLKLIDLGRGARQGDPIASSGDTLCRDNCQLIGVPFFHTRSADKNNRN